MKQKREHIKQYVKKWMDGHEPDTFVKDEYGNVIYSAGHSSLNLVSFFENLLEDYIDETESAAGADVVEPRPYPANEQGVKVCDGGCCDTGTGYCMFCYRRL